VGAARRAPTSHAAAAARATPRAHAPRATPVAPQKRGFGGREVTRSPAARWGGGPGKDLRRPPGGGPPRRGAWPPRAPASSPGPARAQAPGTSWSSCAPKVGGGIHVHPTFVRWRASPGVGGLLSSVLDRGESGCSAGLGGGSRAGPGPSASQPLGHLVAPPRCSIMAQVVHFVTLRSHPRYLVGTIYRPLPSRLTPSPSQPASSVRRHDTPRTLIGSPRPSLGPCRGHHARPVLMDRARLSHQAIAFAFCESVRILRTLTPPRFSTNGLELRFAECERRARSMQGLALVRRLLRFSTFRPEPTKPTETTHGHPRLPWLRKPYQWAEPLRPLRRRTHYLALHAMPRRVW